MYMDRRFMIYLSLHWTESGIDDLYLCSFAVKHSLWVYNWVPNQSSVINPMEMLTKKKSNHLELRRSHICGCLVYVLESKFQNSQKLPKWNQRSWLGQFIGFSEDHSTQVANSRHLQTGYISPQYHLVFDDLFETSVFLRGQWPRHWQYLQLTFQFKQILVRWRILWLCRPINLPPTIFFWRLARWARTSWTEIRTWQEAQPPRTTNSREEQVCYRAWDHPNQY